MAVSLAVGMLATVNFDNQFMLEANKIDNVRIYWHLPLKF